jgi:hypothetical protein
MRLIDLLARATPLPIPLASLLGREDRAALVDPLAGMEVSIGIVEDRTFAFDVNDLAGITANNPQCTASSAHGSLGLDWSDSAPARKRAR